MKKTALIIILAFCMSLICSCGDDNQSGDDGSGYMFNACLNGNPKSLDPQYADDESSNTVISNMFSGLLKYDLSGNIVCDTAESYDVSEDGKTYTFTLRRDNFWFFDENDNDKIDDGETFNVTAADYVFAFERLLNPETQSPHSKDFLCIEGAEAMINGSSSELSGIFAQDDYTLVFHLEYANADFLNMLTTNAAKPCNSEFFYNTKGRYGLDEKSVISNGAFFMRQWFYDPYGSNNILYMKKNDANSEYDMVYPSYLSFSIEDSSSAVEKLFKAGSVDCISSMSFDNSYNKNKYYYTSSKTYTLGLVFNSNDEIYSNENLRKAIALSIDRAQMNKELGDDVSAAFGIIPNGVSLLGRSYRELSSDSSMTSCDIDTALSCFDAAKAELGVESFSTVKILVSTRTVNSEYLHILSQQWQEILGYYIGVEEVSESEFQTRISEGDYSIALYPVTADYNSGVSFLKQFDNEVIGVSGSVSNTLKELDHTANSSDYVEQFSSIEKMIIDEYCFVPVFYKNTYLVSKTENKDVMYDAFSKTMNFRVAKNFG